MRWWLGRVVKCDDPFFELNIMKKLLLIAATALLLSCNKPQPCPEYVDVKITSSTDINKVAIRLGDGIGTVRFGRESIDFPAYVGASVRVYNAHKSDTTMTVNVNGRKYDIEAGKSIDVTIYCN